MSYLFAHKLQTFFDANGNPLSGGKIYAYADGTSSLLNTYSNSALSSANTNPVVLNSAGKPPQNIYLSASAYRLELYTSADVLVAQCADVKGQLPVINPATDANKAVVVNSGATGYTTAAVALGSASYITVDAEASLPNSYQAVSTDFLTFTKVGDTVSFGLANPVDFGGKELKNAVLNLQREKKNALTGQSGAVTIDYSLGSVCTIAQTGNITSVSVTNVPASSTVTLTVIRSQADATLRTMTWGAAYNFSGGTTPTLSNSASAVDVFTLITTDGGSNWQVGAITGVS
jgi:hypothetical protein